MPAMSVELWLAFVVASTIVLIIPGPTILTVVSYLLAYGRRAYVPVVAAAMLGDSTAIVLSLLGLGALLAASALLFAAVVNVTLYSMFTVSSRRLLSTLRAQRGFNVLGGSMLSATGVYALLARRSA